ncbi:iron ABC transporter permease [Ancylobacter sp. FA202]|uniref:FecCD family ABC transporter permease n=1 Tax=Ancylobacter sp. FA202 TaxID=1111106 RepID=UPI00037652C7|nr:iron ABC transporter permease [Ancylobacter sp. FA202]
MIRMVLLLLLLIAALAAAALSHGDHPFAWSELASVLTGRPTATRQAELVVMDLRLPRLLLAFLVGAALAVAGAGAQAILRNPLAEPGLLGINAGAGLAAMVVMVGLPSAPISLLPVAGFLGASAMAAAIYLLAWRGGTTPLRLILIGIGLGSVAMAGTALVSTLGDIRDVQRALIWLAGSVHHANWMGVQLLALWLAPPMALVMLATRELDLIGLGDLPARGLGQRVDLIRGMMVLLCTAMAGAAVSAAGLIGFVGLIAPHAARRLVGPSHARLIPITALLGGALVMAADFTGRSIAAPLQLPAGLFTALIGAPFFAYLLWGRRHGFS